MGTFYKLASHLNEDNFGVGFFLFVFGILTLGIALALWFASWSFNGMISLLNQAYQVPETRSYWRTRSLSILVTVIVSIFMIMSAVLLFFGEWLISLVIEPGPLKTFYGIARWMLAFLLLNFGVQIIYFALPAHRFPGKLVSPGGAVAAVGKVDPWGPVKPVLDTASRPRIRWSTDQLVR